MLSVKKAMADCDSDSWYGRLPSICEGEFCHEDRQYLADILRPKPKVKPPFHSLEKPASETLNSLIRVDFQPIVDYHFKEVIDRLPQDLNHLVLLLEMLVRTLIDALELAVDFLGVKQINYRSDIDVPSITAHDQNGYHSGFCPIVQVISEIWKRIAIVSHHVVEYFKIRKAINLAW